MCYCATLNRLIVWLDWEWDDILLGSSPITERANLSIMQPPMEPPVSTLFFVHVHVHTHVCSSHPREPWTAGDSQRHNLPHSASTRHPPPMQDSLTHTVTVRLSGSNFPSEVQSTSPVKREVLSNPDHRDRACSEELWKNSK